MEIKTQNLKEIYEQDFYLWIMENLRLLRNKEYGLVDWENLLEEIEYMARRELRSLIDLMAVIMEHLYKWEHFRETKHTLKAKAQEKEILQRAWEDAVLNLIAWFKWNEKLALKYFDRLPTKEDFPKECPYSFEQIMEYEPWLEG
jgi:hypothetical protein